MSLTHPSTYTSTLTRTYSTTLSDSQTHSWYTISQPISASTLKFYCSDPTEERFKKIENQNKKFREEIIKLISSLKNGTTRIRSYEKAFEEFLSAIEGEIEKPKSKKIGEDFLSDEDFKL